MRYRDFFPTPASDSDSLPSEPSESSSDADSASPRTSRDVDAEGLARWLRGSKVDTKKRA
jgi:hypothetical protein